MWMLKMRISKDELLYRKLQEMQKEMSSAQVEYLHLLANKFVSFNPYQTKYFNYMLKDKVMQKTGLSSLEIHTDFSSVCKSGKWYLI
jgi:hypothetical protein